MVVAEDLREVKDVVEKAALGAVILVDEVLAEVRVVEVRVVEVLVVVAVLVDEVADLADLEEVMAEGQDLVQVVLEDNFYAVL